MQSTGARVGILAVLIAVVVGFIVIKGGDSKSDSGSGATKTVNIDVVHRKPVGGVKTLKFTNGDKVHLHVTVDEPAEELHVHGYELEGHFTKGVSDLSFTANNEGIYPIEIHYGDDEATIAMIETDPA